MSEANEIMDFSMDDFQDFEVENDDLEFIADAADNLDEEEIDSDEEIVDETIDESSEDETTPADTSIEEDADENEESDDENIFKTFASALVEAGVISKKEEGSFENIKSFDELKDVIRDEIRSNEFADLNDYQKEYLTKLSKGITHEEIVAVNNEKSLLTKLEDADLEDNEDLRRQLIFSDFVAKGISEERAKKLTERSFETLSDLEDAQEALKTRKESIKKYEENLEKQRQQELENAKKENEKRIEQIKTTLFDNTKEIIKGLTVNEQVAKRVFENITKPVKHDNNGRPVSKIMEERSKDPVNFDIKLNLLFEMTEGFSKIDKFLNNGKTQAIKKFDEKLKTTTFTKGTNTTNFRVDPNFNKLLDTLEKSAGVKK